MVDKIPIDEFSSTEREFMFFSSVFCYKAISDKNPHFEVPKPPIYNSLPLEQPASLLCEKINKF